MRTASRFSLTLAALAAVLLSGCGQGFYRLSGGDSNPPAHANKSSDLTGVEKSEALSDEGEALLHPQTFDEASGKFAEALQANPQNQRAIFWRGVLGLALKFKGIIARVRPLYASNPGRYAELLNNTNSGKNADLVRFLKSGPEDITGGAELQDWLDSLDQGITDLRSALRQIRDSEITIQLPTEFTPVPQFARCQETHYGPIVYKDPSCEPNAPNTVSLNRGDFDVLLAGAGAYQIMIEMWTAYRINPTAMLGVFGNVSTRDQAQKVLDTIWDIQDAGKPRKPFAQLKSVVSEVADGLRAAIENQSELCPRGVYDVTNRRGYLIGFGVCVSSPGDDSLSQRNLTTLETILSGNPVDVIVDGKVKAKVLPLKLAEQPLANAKDLLPITFDDCGNATGFNSAALQPYFAMGSFDDLKNSQPPVCKTAVRP